MGSNSQHVEDEESSDDKEAQKSPILQPNDDTMGSNGSQADAQEGFQNDVSPKDSPAGSIREHGSDSESASDDDDDDEDDNPRFPFCYPVDPPLVEILPVVQYPEDAPRSSPSDRNLDFERMVRNNFVPFAKGLKGDAYRRRTDYEHQKIMG